ncbi:hypothetical protein [Paenibacillus sanguinis]|uniref:hypothetical protein n=1 Tax=Paenibacillus sanguinis TaxID=225906 RepID=UPI000379EB6C|nr:hypothetical protein [Paenibacillus sanguinis]
MAANNKAPSISQGPAPKLEEISELKRRLNVPDSIYQGMTAAERWKPGRQVTEAKFEEAVKRFCGNPISGKKVKKDA